LKKKIAVGVVSHRTLQADTPQVVADRARRAAAVIPLDKLVLSTDCGFGRQGFNRHVAFYKTTAIAQARNIVLQEQGLEPRYVAAADDALQMDVLPDDESLVTQMETFWSPERAYELGHTPGRPVGARALEGGADGAAMSVSAEARA
jgi:hypothetical protein